MITYSHTHSLTGVCGRESSQEQFNILVASTEHSRGALGAHYKCRPLGPPDLESESALWQDLQVIRMHIWKFKSRYNHDFHTNTKMNLGQRFYNSLINEETIKILQLFQRKMQKLDTYIGHQEYEFNLQIDANLTQTFTGQ